MLPMMRAGRPLRSLAGARRHMSFVPSWATIDPYTMSAASPAVGKNLCGGVWSDAKATHTVIDPLNGDPYCKVPDTKVDEIGPFVERMANCPRTGLHNPIRNVERYNMLGEVMAKASRELAKPEVNEYFAKLIQRLVPKSWAQCAGEPTVTRKWMESYSCDQVRYLARSFGIPGDHAGQTSTGIRMPFGGVSVITPFNFPLEICALQTCSALFMGNQPTVKVDWKVAICMEQFIRMLHHVGLVCVSAAARALLGRCSAARALACLGLPLPLTASLPRSHMHSRRPTSTSSTATDQSSISWSSMATVA